MNQIPVLGADIGGSHITTALVDIGEGALFGQSLRRKAIDSKGSAADILQAWCSIMQESLDALNVKPASIGLAIPGPFDYDSGVSLMKDQDKFDSLYGINVKNHIANFFNLRNGILNQFVIRRDICSNYFQHKIT